MLRGMKFRTIYSKEPKHLRNYINKGIRICAEWLADAAEFDRWALANGWKEGLTIDRIDHRGGYEPSNCQFITAKQNIRKASHVKLTQAKVDDIRARFVPGLGGNYKALAEEFGMGARHLHMIVKGRIWQPDSEA